MIDLAKCIEFLKKKEEKRLKKEEELKSKIREKLKNIGSIFQKYKEVEFAYLFGSFIKGNFSEFSDIDIAINKVDTQSFFDLWKDLEELLDWNVDLKEFKKGSNFEKIVKKNGILIYERRKN